MDGMKLFAIYLAVMNVLGVAVMWSDKRRARLHRWRILEKVLFGVSLLGGSAGTWAGMYLFRHKTKHWYFVVGMPLILVCQAALAIYLVHLYVL
jgi:uncharacterized membrane protein YsdA (DUF1294 family)